MASDSSFDLAFVFDAVKVETLLRQVAIVQAISVNTETKWKDVDNGVLTGLYALKSLITLGNSAKPGFVETGLKPGTSIHHEVESHLPVLWKGFMEAFAKGPGVAKEYLERKQRMLKRDLHELDKLRIEAKMVNQEVDQLLQEALFWTLTVKFSAEIAMNILGLIPGGGIIGFLVRTGVGLSYPVGVELVNNWENAKVANISLLALMGAIKTNLSSILTEDETMGRAECKLVKDPVKRAQAEADFQKALRKVGAGKGSGLKNAKANVVTVKATANARGLLLKGAGTALTGFSCYFAYTGSVQSGEAYQEALENL